MCYAVCHIFEWTWNRFYFETIRSLTQHLLVWSSCNGFNKHVEDILKFIERGQMRWYGHVKRMEDGRYPKKYLEWTHARRRPVGRPRKRWLENIDMCLGKRGSSLLETERDRLFDDRRQWRELLRQDDWQAIVAYLASGEKVRRKVRSCAFVFGLDFVLVYC